MVVSVKYNNKFLAQERKVPGMKGREIHSKMDV